MGNRVTRIGLFSSAFLMAFAAIMSMLALPTFIISVLPTVGLEAHCLSGQSMEPNYHSGDLLVVKRGQQPKEDEPFVFITESGGLVFHRMVSEQFAESGGYITKGDNNDVNDGWLVGYNDVVGTELFTLPKAGFLAGSSAWSAGIALMLCIFMFLSGILLYLILIGDFVWIGRREFRDREVTIRYV